MPSLRHQFLAAAVPRVRRSRELDSEEHERERLLRWQATLDPALPTGLVPGLGRRFEVTTDHDAGFPVHTLTPRGATPERTVVWMHGGGFVSGIDAFHVRYLARLGRRLRARIVIPDYPLAPEFTWRDSHDAHVALVARWCEQGPVLLGGDSAGGNIALAVAQSLRDAGLPAPEQMLLLAPWVDLTTSTPSTTWFAARDPWLRLSKLHAYADWWAGSPADLDRPEVSPALGDLNGLPPTLLLCGTRDLLLPGCRLLVSRAADADWRLVYREEPDLIHVYPILPGIPEARRAWAQTSAFLDGRRVPA